MPDELDSVSLYEKFIISLKTDDDEFVLKFGSEGDNEFDLRFEESEDLTIRFEETTPNEFVLTFEDDDEFNLRFGELTRVAPDTYQGPYTVTPSSSEQILETEYKMMTDDVTVHSIPYFSTENPQGGNTVYIGGEITIN